MKSKWNLQVENETDGIEGEMERKKGIGKDSGLKCVVK